jgi:hypothetical protein
LGGFVDTEMNVATLNAELAQGLRLMLQSEHLGLVSDDELLVLSGLLGQQRQTQEEQEHALQVLNSMRDKLDNPLVALNMMHERAWENLRRYKAKQPLVGHLLPYLTAEEATQQGLNFREAHGWIEEP